MKRILVAALAIFFLMPTASQAQNASGRKLEVCLVSGSLEYDSDQSLAILQKYLEKNYPIRCTWAKRKTDSELTGLEHLDTCDVMILFTRRMKLEGAQLERIKRYCQSGKPIVGIRTASHAIQSWLALDKEILGGNYKNHYGAGITKLHTTKAGAKHPILKGVTLTQSAGSLYRNTGLAKDVTILMTGTYKTHDEPVTWTRLVNDGRVFYTSLGHQKDFQDENYLRMIANAIYWTTATK